MSNQTSQKKATSKATCESNEDGKTLTIVIESLNGKPLSLMEVLLGLNNVAKRLTKELEDAPADKSKMN